MSTRQWDKAPLSKLVELAQQLDRYGLSDAVLSEPVRQAWQALVQATPAIEPPAPPPLEVKPGQWDKAPPDKVVALLEAIAQDPTGLRRGSVAAQAFAVLRDATPTALELQPGRFYKARSGDVWLCMAERAGTARVEKHLCIRLADSRVETFYADGRYDEAGEREHCLVEECGPEGEALTS